MYCLLESCMRKTMDTLVLDIPGRSTWYSSAYDVRIPKFLERRVHAFDTGQRISLLSFMPQRFTLVTSMKYLATNGKCCFFLV
jgi:hypothetical protein